MKKVILAVTVLAITLMAGPALGQTVAEMVAGNPKNPPANVVGTVTVTDDGTSLTVVYEITDPEYIITETHLEVSAVNPASNPKVAGAIPQTKKGNAIPGQFTYSSSHETADGVTEVTHIIPLPAGAPPTYIAAHAVVAAICDCEPCDLEVPDTVSVSVVFGSTNPFESYFDATISNGADDLPDGHYPAYCIDTDNSIFAKPDDPLTEEVDDPRVYDGADVYLTCDPDSIPEGLIEFPENLGKANWILNNIIPGVTQSSAWGAFTWQDIQRALWELLDDNDVDDDGVPIVFPPGPETGIAGMYSQDRVDEMIEDAEDDEEANGVFMPGCGQDVGVILIPWEIDDATGLPRQKQALLVVIPAPCCWCDDTAWAGRFIGLEEDAKPAGDGDGYLYEFPGKDWSMYFIHPE